jgi:hypothetical protein
VVSGRAKEVSAAVAAGVGCVPLVSSSLSLGAVLLTEEEEEGNAPPEGGVVGGEEKEGTDKLDQKSLRRERKGGSVT